MNFKLTITNPNLRSLGYMIGVANIMDKHDRSAPSHYHWKILKCRMIIFSSSSILACPDKQDVQRVHIIFNKRGDDYDKINSMFWKFSLIQDGAIRTTTSEIFELCFRYTMIARMAPIWNILGNEYLINNRDFLTTKGPQEGVRFIVKSNDNTTVIEIKPIKLIIQQIDNDVMSGEYVRVLPSLNKAIVEEYYAYFPEAGVFKSYKDLRRHWKNIHGYRLPEQDCSSYYLIRFWRGEPLTYPKYCVIRNFPIVTPMPKPAEKVILSKFMSCLKNKLSNILGTPLNIQDFDEIYIKQVANANIADTQDVSLCTPTQPRQSSNFN